MICTQRVESRYLLKRIILKHFEHSRRRKQVLKRILHSRAWACIVCRVISRARGKVARLPSSATVTEPNNTENRPLVRTLQTTSSVGRLRYRSVLMKVPPRRNLTATGKL